MCLKVCLGTHQWPHNFVLYKSIQGVYLYTFVYQGFTNSIEGGNPSYAGGILLSSGWNLRRSDFDHLNLFQS